MRVRAVGRAVLAAAASALVLVACEGSPGAPSSDAVFEVRACGSQTFRIRLTNADLVQQAGRLAGQPGQPIVNGRLARGSGGFNDPWSWHLLPETVRFADVTIELCDGCPQMVEDDLDYWLETVQQFCPWSSEIVRRVR
jgi:hypothetical protein